MATTEKARYLVVRLLPDLFKRIEDASNYCGVGKSHFARTALENLCKEVERFKQAQVDEYKHTKEEDGEERR